MDERRGRRRRRATILVALAAGTIGFLVVFGAVTARDARIDDRFDLVRWEIDTFPNRWVTLAGRAFHGSPDPDELIRTYYSYLEGDPARDELQADLQLIVASRIDAVLQEMGLSARIEIPASVFPPVNLQIARAPQVLVTSPRSVIERDRVELLRPDLPLARVLELEAEAAGPDVASIVVPAGGVATYPAIVIDRSSYAGLLRIAAHEWVHHYLAFYPLGFRYFLSDDARTINETVADLVGDEVAALVLERWGDPTAAAPSPSPAIPPAAATPPASEVDLAATLRALRIEVDELLEAGAVEEAEARMEEVRVELAEEGIVIRRLNQAYFAWFGTYAARPDAVDPLGGHLREIRERAGTLPAFIEVVRGLESRDAVERELAALEGVEGEAR